MLAPARNLTPAFSGNLVGAGAFARLPGVVAQGAQALPQLTADQLAGAKISQADAVAASAVVPHKQHGLIYNTLEGAESLVSKYFMGEMVAGAASMIIGGGLGAASSKLLGKEHKVTNGFKAVSDVVSMPFNAAAKTESMRVGSASVAGVGSLAEQMGAKNVAASIKRASEHVANAENTVGSYIQRGFDSAGDALGKLNGKDAPLGNTWLSNRAANNAAYDTKQFNTHFADLEKHIGERASWLHDVPVHENTAERRIKAVASTQKLEESIQALKGAPLSDAKNVAHYAEHIANGREALESLKGLHAGSKGVPAQALHDAEKLFSKAEKSFHNVSNYRAKQAFWQDIPAAIKEIPGNVGRISVSQAVWKGSVIAGAAVQATDTFTSARDQLSALKEMCATLEGKQQPVSAIHALTSSDVPQVIKEARSQMIKQFGPQSLLQAIATSVNWKMASHSNMGFGMGMMGMVAVQMAAGLGADMCSNFNQLVPQYCAMKQHFASGKPLGEADYAGLMMAVNPKLEKLGADNGLLSAVAAHYAANRTSPEQLLREAGNGQMDALAAQVAQAMGTQGRMAGDKVSPDMSVASVAAPTTRLMPPAAYSQHFGSVQERYAMARGDA